VTGAAASSWLLDPRLAQDTVPLADLSLSRVLILKDANYPWLVLVPRRPGLVEIIDLHEPDQLVLMREMAQVARALKAVTECEKLNIAALGNTVRQLHVHVIGRRADDPAGPRPVWDVAPPRPYDDHELRAFSSALRAELGVAE
jgi:diadenosine tetraphosphate (Ap4A) HIT family hydrolase